MAAAKRKLTQVPDGEEGKKQRRHLNGTLRELERAVLARKEAAPGPTLTLGDAAESMVELLRPRTFPAFVAGLERCPRMVAVSPGIGGEVLPHAVAFLLRQLEGKVVAAVRSSRLLWCGVGRVMLLKSQKPGSDSKKIADSTRLVMHTVVGGGAKGAGVLGKDCVAWLARRSVVEQLTEQGAEVPASAGAFRFAHMVVSRQLGVSPQVRVLKAADALGQLSDTAVTEGEMIFVFVMDLSLFTESWAHSTIQQAMLEKQRAEAKARHCALACFLDCERPGALPVSVAPLAPREAHLGNP